MNSALQHALAAFKAGKFVIVTDDADRENEGDLIMAADAATDERVSGLIMANLQKFIWKDGDSLEVAVRNAYRSTDFYKGQAMRLDTWKRLSHHFLEKVFPFQTG